MIHIALQMKFGILLTCCKSSNGNQFCVIRGFQELLSQGEARKNELGCPLLLLTHMIVTLRASVLLNAVSIMQECDVTCKFLTRQCPRNVERQSLSFSALDYQHNFYNYNYCFNVYCMKS